MADFALLESLKLISRKIWVIENHEISTLCVKCSFISCRTMSLVKLHSSTVRKSGSVKTKAPAGATPTPAPRGQAVGPVTIATPAPIVSIYAFPCLSVPLTKFQNWI